MHIIALFRFLVLSSRQLYVCLHISRDCVPGYSRFARYCLPDRVCCLVVLLSCCLVVCLWVKHQYKKTKKIYLFIFIYWYFIPQQSDHKFCLEDSTLPVYAHRIFYMFWYCLPDSSFLLFFISRDFVPGYMNQGVTWLAGTTW